MWLYSLQTKQTHCLADLGKPGLTQPRVKVLDAFFLWYLSLCKKIYDTTCFLTEILMIKESYNLIGQNTFQSII